MGKLLRHIYLEFKYGDELNEDNVLITEENKCQLCESFGCIPNLDSYVDIFRKALEENKGNFILTEDDFDVVPDTFFNKLQIIVRNRGKETYSGGYSYNKSGFGKIGNDIVYLVRIYIIRSGNIEEDLKSFAHELTHSYDDYNRKERILKNNLRNINPIKSNGKARVRDYKGLNGFENYHNIVDASNGYGDTYNIIGEILYYLFKTEKNAYIGQLGQELRILAGTISDSKSATKAIQKTEVYDRYKWLKENIEVLVEMNKATDVDEVKEDVISAFYEITGRCYQTYNQVVKALVAKYRKFERQFLTNSSKIAYDVFLKYGQKTFENIHRKNNKIIGK